MKGKDIFGLLVGVGLIMTGGYGAMLGAYLRAPPSLNELSSIVIGVLMTFYILAKELRTKGTSESTITQENRGSGLRGSFPLDEKTIDAEVIVPSSPGVYALGHLKANTFIIQHIGHSETDLKAQLKRYIGKYDRFKFEYADSPQTAIDKEREVYYALDRTRRP